MAALPKIDKAAEQAARFGAEAANDAKAMANMAAARKSGLVQQASSGSMLDSFIRTVSKASNILFLAPIIGGAVGLVGKIKPLAKIAGTTKAAIDLHNVPVGQFAQKAGEVANGHSISKAVESGSLRLANYANKTIGSSKFGSKALASIKDVSVSSAVINTGFAVQQTAGVAISFRDKVRTLKQMHKDLTGKDVSTMSVLMGGDELSPIVKQARKQAFGGRSLTAAGLEIAGAAGNLYLAFFDKSKGAKAFAKSLAIGMGPSMLAGIATSGSTALQSYRDMTLSMAQSGKADVSLYEGLVGGLAQKAPGELVRQIAEKAYVKQMAPGEVVKMMAETDFMQNPESRKLIPVQAKSFVAAENARRAAANDATHALRA